MKLPALLLLLAASGLAGAAAPPSAGAAYRELPETVSADGVVEAVRQSTLAAQIAGQLVELRVKVGERVKAGQVLARIDPRAADQAVAAGQGQVAEARAAKANADRTVARSRKLFVQKFISQAGLDQAELDARAAAARLATLQAGAGQAATARTFATISAPYDAIVAATPVEVGDMAIPGRALLIVFDPSSLRVLATLPQASLRRIQLGKAVAVELPDLGRTLAARRATVLPLADSRSHAAKLRLELGAAEGLMPGQFARAHFVTGSARRLAIPQAALLRRSEVTAVYVLAAGAPAQLRQVRTGEPAADGYVEVLAGLREGERVALDPVLAGMR